MYQNIREKEGFYRGSNFPSDTPIPEALGLDALHDVFKELYPDQNNPLTVTTLLKYWLGGPDPLDYINMFENPGVPELGVPPHWHYISLGLTDLHGDNRTHIKSGPGRPSGYGFELTFRLARETGETAPPTWPANIMQQLARYVFNSGNKLYPGDHVTWPMPLGNNNGKITQLLMSKDAQLSNTIATPNGEISFVQIVGITSDELRAAQHWSGTGIINLLKTAKCCDPWLVTNINRPNSIIEEDPTIIQHIDLEIEREGSNLGGVSAKCWWVQMTTCLNNEKYRDNNKDESDNEEDNLDKDDNDDNITANYIPKIPIKSENISLDDESSHEQSLSPNNTLKILTGVHLTFNLEAGSLLPLVVKGRLKHGRHFTFKSISSHSAITLVPSSVTGSLVTSEKPYVVQSLWLQVLIPDDLVEKMANEFQILNSPEQLQLPKTFSWPEYNLAFTIIYN